MKDKQGRSSRGHFCVDYCAPPEHADLCHSCVEYDEIGNHLQFEADFWQLYRVVVTKVQRLPELDGFRPDKTPDGRKASTVEIRRGDVVADKAFMVRWRGDMQRTKDRLRRLQEIRATYGKTKITDR